MSRPRGSSCGSLPAPDGVDEESVGGFEVGGDSSLRRTRRRRVRRRLEAEGGVEDAVSENAEIILKNDYGSKREKNNMATCKRW